MLLKDRTFGGSTSWPEDSPKRSARATKSPKIRAPSMLAFGTPTLAEKGRSPITQSWADLTCLTLTLWNNLTMRWRDFDFTGFYSKIRRALCCSSCHICTPRKRNCFQIWCQNGFDDVTKIQKGTWRALVGTRYVILRPVVWLVNSEKTSAEVHFLISGATSHQSQELWFLSFRSLKMTISV